jgi:hypothetical protein
MWASCRFFHGRTGDELEEMGRSLGRPGGGPSPGPRPPELHPRQLHPGGASTALPDSAGGVGALGRWVGRQLVRREPSGAIRLGLRQAPQLLALMRAVDQQLQRHAGGGAAGSRRPGAALELHAARPAGEHEGGRSQQDQQLLAVVRPAGALPAAPLAAPCAALKATTHADAVGLGRQLHAALQSGGGRACLHVGGSAAAQQVAVAAILKASRLAAGRGCQGQVVCWLAEDEPGEGKGGAHQQPLQHHQPSAGSAWELELALLHDGWGSAG